MTRPAEVGAHVAAGEPDTRRRRLAGLLDQARAGDRAALGEIVTTLTPLLWHVARAQGLHREAAEDVVQSTWLTLLTHLEEVRSPLALTEWLVVTTRRGAWRAQEAAGRQQPVAPESLPENAVADDGPDQQVLDRQQARCLWENVQRLPERCHGLMRVVAFVDRPDYEVVSRALGMPRGSIGPTRGRCLDKLRSLLAEDARWSWT